MAGMLNRPNELLRRRTADALLLLRPGTGVVVHLEGTGVAIWDALEDGASFDELVEDLASRFDAPREVIAADVRIVLHDLIADGLVMSS